MNLHKEISLSVLRAARGDDLARAKAAWGHFTQDQLQEQYGQSGKTHAERIAGWQEHEDKINAAIAWLESVPE